MAVRHEKKSEGGSYGVCENGGRKTSPCVKRSPKRRNHCIEHDGRSVNGRDPRLVGRFT